MAEMHFQGENSVLYFYFLNKQMLGLKRGTNGYRGAYLTGVRTDELA